MTFRINEPTVVYQAFPDEVVAINLEAGDYFSIAKVGAEIWHLVALGLSPERIASLVAARWTADPSVVAADVSDFLANLQGERLIVPAPAKESTQEEPRSAAESRADYEKPELSKYTDMQELLLLDPIHDVDDSGWPGTSRTAAAPPSE